MSSRMRAIYAKWLFMGMRRRNSFCLFPLWLKDVGSVALHAQLGDAGGARTSTAQ